MIDYHKYQKEIDDILKDTIIIKHIPHSSLLFPEDYDDDNLKRIYGLDYKIQNIKLTDLFIDYVPSMPAFWKFYFFFIINGC